MELQAQADQQHAKFDDEKSEFSGYLRLWKWLHEARGGKASRKAGAKWLARPRPRRAPRRAMRLFCPWPSAARAPRPSKRRPIALAWKPDAGVPVPADDATHKLSNRQYEQLLRQNFINMRRVREWRDIHRQLHHRGRGAQVADQRRARRLRGTAQVDAGGPAGQHRLQAARKSDSYLGARGIKFYRHPGAHLKKKPGRWIVVRRTGGDHAPVRPRHRQHRAAVARTGGGPPAEEAAARPALGEEGAPR